MNKLKKLFFILFSFSFIFSFSFADSTTPEAYNEEEIPETLRDLRRFEIVTLGALPFVMLDTTLAYSSYSWVMNDFNSEKTPTAFASSSRFDSDEQKALVLTSLGISIGVGLTDYIFRLVKRLSENKKQEIFNTRDITIVPVIPVDEDPEATQIPLSRKKSETELSSDFSSEKEN